MKKIMEVEAHESYVLDVAFSQDGRLLVTAGMDNAIRLWIASGWEALRTLTGHEKSVNGLALAPGGDVLASCSSDGTVRLWTFPEGKPLHVLRDRKKTAAQVAFSPGGKWVSAAYYGGKLAVWDRAGELVTSIKASEKNLSCLAFAPIKQADREDEDRPDVRVEVQAERQMEVGVEVRVSDKGDGGAIAAGGLGDVVTVWSLPSSEPIAALSGHGPAVIAVAFDGAGRLYALGYEGTLNIWNWHEADVIGQANVPGARGLRFAPDGARFALALEGAVALYAADGSQLDEAEVGTKAVNGMAFSPDGRLLAVGAADGKVRIFELA